MSDLISRQAAIDAVSHHGEIENDYTDLYHDGYCDGVYDSVDTLEDLPPAQQWIPVSERLPEYKMQVLTIDKDGDYELNHIVDEEDGEWYWGHVIAWMPLPKPWKGEER